MFLGQRSAVCDDITGRWHFGSGVRGHNMKFCLVFFQIYLCVFFKLILFQLTQQWQDVKKEVFWWKVNLQMTSVSTSPDSAMTAQCSEFRSIQKSSKFNCFQHASIIFVHIGQKTTTSDYRDILLKPVTQNENYCFFSGAFMATQTLVETQQMVANFNLNTTAMISDNNSDAGQDSSDKAETVNSKLIFKEYIPGEPDSDDDLGHVPYVDTDDETNTSASTNSAITPEDPPQHYKEPVSESEFKDLQGKTFAPATNKKIGWAIKLFCDWHKNRLEKNLGGVQIESSDILDPKVDVDYLKNTICLFLSEVR